MKIAQLRKDLPHWTWRAERDGFGYSYVGMCGDRQVRVWAVACFSGYTDDDFSTLWLALENGKECYEDFARFLLREASAASASAPPQPQR